MQSKHFNSGAVKIHLILNRNLFWFTRHHSKNILYPFTADFLEQILAFQFKNGYKIRNLLKSLATIYFQKVKIPTNFVVNFVAKKLATID